MDRPQFRASFLHPRFWPLWLGLGLAAAQVLWHYRLIRTRTRAGCFVAFSKSHWIGAAIFAGVALGFALR